MYFAAPLKLVKMTEWMTNLLICCSHRVRVWLKQVLQAIKYRNTAFQTSKYSAGLVSFLVPCTNCLIHRGEEWSNFVTGEMNYSISACCTEASGKCYSATKHFEIFPGGTHHKRWLTTLSGSTPNQSCRIFFRLETWGKEPSKRWSWDKRYEDLCTSLVCDLMPWFLPHLEVFWEF